MNFPEYLKERISEDYKNLIIQKLEEIKSQSDALGGTIPPVLFERDQSLRDVIQSELSKVQDALEAELSSAQEKIRNQIGQTIDEFVSSWWHSDVSPYQQQLEMLISDIVSNIPPPPVKESGDLASLVQLMHQIDHANTQSEILNHLLQHIASWVHRAVLFVIKGEQANGWAALGLGEDWDVDRVLQVRVDLTRSTILQKVLETGEGAYGTADEYSDNGELFLLIGNTFPRTTLAFPIFVRGKIAGILYADLMSDLSDSPDLPNLLYLACRAAGFAIDLLPYRPKQARPAEVPATATEQPSAEVEAEANKVPYEAEPETEESYGAKTVSIPVPIIERTEEDIKLHEAAKRFARLLVSEIKLYNEAQVSAGRENRDLYERLRDDIERSRRMYMDRFPSHLHSSSNYFYEELVRTLANGDPSLLGM